MPIKIIKEQCLLDMQRIKGKQFLALSSLDKREGGE